MTKICSKCKVEKPLAEFYTAGKGRIQSQCVTCHSSESRGYYKDNKQRMLVKNRDRDRERKFGVTKEQYDKMLKQQKNCCAICKTHVSELTRVLAVDHCHETGKVRGLLCGSCNRGIGLLKDNALLLREAAEYLEQ